MVVIFHQMIMASFYLGAWQQMNGILKYDLIFEQTLTVSSTCCFWNPKSPAWLPWATRCISLGMASASRCGFSISTREIQAPSLPSTKLGEWLRTGCKEFLLLLPVFILPHPLLLFILLLSYHHSRPVPSFCVWGWWWYVVLPKSCIDFVTQMHPKKKEKKEKKDSVYEKAFKDLKFIINWFGL